MNGHKRFVVYSYGVKEEVLTDLVNDFIERYGYFGITANDLIQLFDSWLYWKRKTYNDENNTDKELHSYLFEKSHIILGYIVDCMQVRKIGIFRKF